MSTSSALTSSRARRRILLLAALATTASCDKEARVDVLGGRLAVGAYLPISYGDKTGNTLTGDLFVQMVTEVLELTSSDPSVSEVIDRKDHPGGAAAMFDHYLLGKSAGQTTLHFKGRFEDGSVREASTIVYTAVADSAAMSLACDNATTVSNLLVPVGSQDQFTISLFAGSEALSGWMPNAVTADGVTQVYDEGLNPYVWRSPLSPMVLQLQSTAVPSVTGTLTAFGPEQVTEIGLVTSNDMYRNTFTAPSGDFSVQTSVVVSGQPVCRPLPAELHAMTPEICSGPAGETVLDGDTYGVSVTAHAEGICTVGASMPGAPVVSTLSFPVFLVSPPPDWQDLAFGVPCSPKGATACQVGFGWLWTCRDSGWDQLALCPADQVCDFVPDTTAGCVVGGVCAQCRGLR